ncbi:hypothetical protein ACUTAF_01965 [Pseudomonas sp. SP16.1]|uniref:hypothetical protein n=1 Tax=Pseudomonas sp. SP16.1 TaxID=3458854 RepID=UPI0040464DE1
MSIYRQQQTHSSTRDMVLIAHAADMLSRTCMSKEDFAESLSRALYSLAPEKARAKEVPDLEALTLTADHQSYSRAAGAWLKRVQRWLAADTVEFPAWIEEAWVQSMLPEWRERCLIELAGRYGLLAVRPVGVEGMGPMKAFSGLMGHMGGVAGLGAQVFDDLVIDEQDAEFLPGFVSGLRALSAKAETLAAAAEKVMGVSEKQGA